MYRMVSLTASVRGRNEYETGRVKKVDVDNKRTLVWFPDGECIWISDQALAEYICTHAHMEPYSARCADCDALLQRTNDSW